MLAALLAPWGPAPAGATPLKAGYAYPQGAFVGADEDRQTDDGARGALAVGTRINDVLDLEVEGFYEVLGRPSGGDHQFGAALHGLAYLRRWEPFSPFALGGVGVMLGEDYFNRSPFVFGELGGGVTSRLPTTHLLVRVDLRYRQVRTMDGFWDRPFADAIVGLGLVFPLGSPPRAPSPPSAAPPPPAPDGARDADGDGIADPRDLCPDTPAGTAVNPAGCTADLDRDGVDDGRDRCPHTAPGTAVDAAGCPADSKKGGAAP